MVGKLTISMIYKPELGYDRQLWGDFTITYKDDTGCEELHHTIVPVDNFIKWYVISSPYIFSDLRIPLINDNAYAESLEKYLKTFTGKQRTQIFTESTKFHNIYNAFAIPSEPDIYLVRRGEYGEASTFQTRKTHLAPIPRFKIGT